MAKPKKAISLIEKARLYTDQALQTLVEVATNIDAPPAARLAAANALLDRAYGKAYTEKDDNITQPNEIRIVAVSPEEATLGRKNKGA